MSFATDIARAQQDPWFYVAIDGIAERFCTHKLDGFPATWKAWIQTMPLQWSESINIETWQAPSALSFTVQDDSDYLTGLLATDRPEKGLTSGATTAGATTITLSSSTLLAGSGTAYIGKETITYTGNAANELTGVTRAAFASAAVAHGTSTVVSQYPRWWYGRTASIFMGSRATGTSNAQCVYRGMISDVDEPQTKLWRFTVDNALKQAGKPCFNAFQGRVLHWGEYQATIEYDAGATPPKVPEVDFQNAGAITFDINFPPRLSSRTDAPARATATGHGSPRGFLYLDNGDDSEFASYERLATAYVPAGTTHSCTYWPLINGDFSDWSPVGTDGKMAPYGWELELGAPHIAIRSLNAPYLATDAEYFSNIGPGPRNVANVPLAGEDHVFMGHQSCVDFWTGATISDMKLSQQYIPMVDAEDFDLVFFTRTTVATGSAFCVVRDSQNGEYYRFDNNTWDSDPSAGTTYSLISWTAANEWQRTALTISMDKARTLTVQFGNKSGGDILTATSTNYLWQLANVQIKMATKYGTVPTGPGRITFFNLGHGALGTKQDPNGDTSTVARFNERGVVLDYESSVTDAGRNPTAKEVMAISGSPADVLRIFLTSQDGNATDRWDVLPSGWGPQLTGSEIDTTGLDAADGVWTLDGGTEIYIETDPISNAVSWAMENICRPNGIYLSVSGAGKLKFTICKPSILTWNATNKALEPDATITNESTILIQPTLSHGYRDASNQLKFICDYSWRTQRFMSNVIIKSTGESFTYYGNVNEQVIEAKAKRSFGGGIDSMTARAQRLFFDRGNGRKTYSLTTDLSVLEQISLGETVAITADHAPNFRTGSRGLSVFYCRPVQRTPDIKSGKIEWVFECDGSSNYGYISPSMVVASTADTTHFVAEDNEYTVAGKDYDHFVAGEYIQFMHPTTGAMAPAVIQSVSGADFVLAAPVTSTYLVANSIVTFASRSSGHTAPQDSYVYLANSNNLLEDDSEGKKYV